MFDGDETNVRLIYVAYGVLLFNLIFKCRVIKLCTETTFFVAYMMFGFISILWAEDSREAFIRARGVFLIFALLVFLTTYTINTKKPLAILVAIAAGAVALTGYMIFVYGLSGIWNSIRYGAERLGADINAVNSLGNALAVGLISVLGLTIFYKKRLLIILIIPMLICLIATGSRSASLSLVAGAFVLIVCLLKTKGRISVRISRVIPVVLGVIAVWLVMRNLSATKEIILRLENSFNIITGGESLIKESSTKNRIEYIKIGWQQFLESPIVGKGIGCAGFALREIYGRYTYLHNNYIEILASGGIVGFVLYYTPYLLIFNSLIKRIFRFRDTNPLVFISFGLLIAKLVAHFGTVVYYSKIEFLLWAFWISVLYTSAGDERRING